VETYSTLRHQDAR